jgi:hemerythrin-like domain-containing protein
VIVSIPMHRGATGADEDGTGSVCDHCGCRDLTPIATLMDDHDAIGGLADDVRRAFDAGDRAAAARSLSALTALLAPHVEWEERGLFAELRATGEFVDHVDVLESEHASLDLGLAAAPRDDDGWEREVRILLASLDAHIYKENFGLFPGALAALDGEAWQRVEDIRPLGSAAGVGDHDRHGLDGDRGL